MRALALVLLLGSACGPALVRARLRPDEPERPRELEASSRIESRRCDPRWGLLFPGVGQICTNQTEIGATFAALGTAELGTATAVAIPNDINHPGAAAPLLAFEDLWVLSVADVALDVGLSRHLVYAPEDSLEERLVAPFNGEVLSMPTVSLGIVGLVLADVGVSWLMDPNSVSLRNAGQRPNLFGTSFPVFGGYALATGIGVGMFEGVAVAEESLFRGLFQSDMARRFGETGGWIIGSLVFGAAHTLNALFLPPDQRLSYLLYATPFITLVGGYLGLVYRWSGYSLAPSIALHFWYDLLVSAIGFAADPQHNPLSAGIGFAF